MDNRENKSEKKYPVQNINSNDDEGMGFLAVTILLILFIVLLLNYILPTIRTTIPTSQNLQINVPENIEVNENIR